jgi:hypothetical protein
MKTTSKILSPSEAKRIIEIYSKFDFEQFPKLIDHKLENDAKMVLEFEWINGSVIPEGRIDEAFYELGRFHSLNRLDYGEVGFTTVCHGDFHRNNIIESSEGIKFVDVTYIHEGWNYSDLDYVDFLGVYDKEKYPWMIETGNCLEAYHKGAGLKSDKDMNEKLKRVVAKYSLERNIENGRKNMLDTSFEEEILENLCKNINSPCSFKA